MKKIYKDDKHNLELKGNFFELGYYYLLIL